MRNVIQVFEHETLPVDKSRGFSEEDFKALARYNERHQRRFFDLGHRCIHFANFVGVIQVGNLTIEILPKAERQGENDKGKWHNALVEMLHRSGYLHLESVSEAHLRLKRATLFDLYIECFLNRVADLVHHGLTRKYRRKQGNLTTLKGRLVFSEHIKRNIIHQERFFTSHQCYDHDNVWNRILKQALRIIERTSSSRHLVNTARRLLLDFEGVSDSRATPQTFARLQYGRSTESYRPSISLAELIIRNYTPDVQAGQRNVLAILFDMNELFERYVFTMLKHGQKRLDNANITVKGQQSKPFWHSGRTTTHLRPDIVVTMETEEGPRRVILDTKWKVPDAHRPADEDLRQMYAYNHLFDTAESHLVYPTTETSTHTWGTYAPKLSKEASSTHGCGQWFVDLFDEKGNLDKEVGTRMLQALGNGIFPNGKKQSSPAESV